jgi:hypothetical protein
MSCNTSLYLFTVELWEVAERGRNNAGQVVREWGLTKEMSCDFMPARAEERLVGRQHNPASYNVYVHGDEPVDVSKQLRNLKDSDGNVVEEGPFNIVGVRKHMGFSHVDFITLNAQKVLD